MAAHNSRFMSGSPRAGTVKIHNRNQPPADGTKKKRLPVLALPGRNARCSDRFSLAQILSFASPYSFRG
jgi:hypothetical protein